MNVIIRLQNLPWSANASDIRQFFRGLQIPEGGVHIVGGEDGDAFIAFRYLKLHNNFYFTAMRLRCNFLLFEEFSKYFFNQK
jgi:hypothetical protein